MHKIRKISVVITVGVSALTAHASCADIKASCAEGYKRDNEYCNTLDRQSQSNCFKRAAETLKSCVGNCK